MSFSAVARSPILANSLAHEVDIARLDELTVLNQANHLALVANAKSGEPVVRMTLGKPQAHRVPKAIPQRKLRVAQFLFALSLQVSHLGGRQRELRKVAAQRAGVDIHVGTTFAVFVHS